MKLIFNNTNDDLLILVGAECNSTAEADELLAWLDVRSGSKETANLEVLIPVEKCNPKVTRTDVSQAAIALVQTKGRQALEPILAKYSSKRISEIPEDSLNDALADILEAS